MVNVHQRYSIPDIKKLTGVGLGRSMALALDANGASKVFVMGRREDALKETASLAVNGTIKPVAADISSKESLEKAYMLIAAQTTHVDLVVANSGLMGPRSQPPPRKADGSYPSIAEMREALWSVTMADFTRVFDVNVTGTFYTVVALLPLLEHANKRRPVTDSKALSPPRPQVVITSSIAGFNRQVPYSYSYSTSKAAVTHLIKMLSTTLAPYQIRVNGIAPGLYHTDLAQPLYTSRGIEGAGTTDGSFPADQIPATRGGGEEDIAGLILWMASNSGGYLNGNIMVTDGGRLGVVPSTY